MERNNWEKDVVQLRKLIAKVYEEIARAPPYNEVINENKATESQKYQARKRQRLSHGSLKLGSNRNILDRESKEDDDSGSGMMLLEDRALYEDTSSEDDEAEDSQNGLIARSLPNGPSNGHNLKKPTFEEMISRSNTLKKPTLRVDVSGSNRSARSVSSGARSPSAPFVPKDKITSIDLATGYLSFHIFPRVQI